MGNLNHLLKRLLESKIEFVLIGGYAAVLYGSSQVTQDIDICATMNEANLAELRKILADLDPKHRMNRGFQPSLMDYPPQGQSLDNYYLQTKSGVLDIVQEVIPVGVFDRVNERATTVSLFGHPCRVISIDDLIEVKKAMTRPKDKSVLQELEFIKKKMARK